MEKKSTKKQFPEILISWLLILTVVFSSASAETAEQKQKVKAKERLAVLDLEAKHGIEKSLAEALSGIVRDTLHSFGEYQVMSQEDIRAVASREQLLQAMGCDDNTGTCLNDISRALGTRYMVAGSIAKVGNTYTVSLRMLNTKGDNAGVMKRVNEECQCDEGALIETVKTAAARLASKSVNPNEDRLDPDQVKFTLLSQRYLQGDNRALYELEKLPTYQKLLKQMNLSAPGQKAAAQSSNFGNDRQTVALTAIQSQSEDADSRALAKAMAADLQLSPQGIELLTAEANEQNSFAAMMLEDVTEWESLRPRTRKGQHAGKTMHRRPQLPCNDWLIMAM